MAEIKFIEFCDFCERISTSPRNKKLPLLQNFIKVFRAKKNENPSLSFFPIIRFLLPQLDRVRPAYGIKETTLAKLYIRILCLPKDGIDAQRLMKYRVPTSINSSAKDFAEVSYYVLKNRCSAPSNLSVSEVNTVLDNLSAMNSEKKTADQLCLLLQPLLAQMSAKEQKWLIRIILKDLKIGVGHNTILGAYHPDARELYDVSNDLEKICNSLVDPTDRSLGIEISLFKPFRPMLADRIPLNKIVSKMGHKPFYVETKIDGERTQIHKSGNRYQYFTRRGFDYTSNYGTDPTFGNFTPRVQSCFHENVKSCILDGEMVAWDSEGSFIVSKGDNADVKNLSATGKLIPCFFVFDILFLNDQILTGLPFKERLKVLESIISVKDGVVNYPSRTLISTKTEVTDLLNKAIDQREEGIVLKDPDSIYKPNARKEGWLKVKPEYVGQMMDHLDLIVVGGYHGQGKRNHLISQFLMAVAVSCDENEKPTEFYALGRVGSGYSHQELMGLQEKLNRHWHKWDKNSLPSHIHFGKETPHYWIEPSESVILEVKASEVVVSDANKIGLTLRFPRVERIRGDRAWYQTMTLDDVKKLREMASGKLVTRHCSAHDDQPASKRPRTAGASLGVLSNFAAADTSDVVRSSTCFKDKEMCVYNGLGKLTKQKIEIIIAEASGDIVQHPGPQTFCIVAGTEDLRVKTVRKQLKWDVVRPSWIRRCVDSGDLLPFRPEDMLVTSVQTSEQMAQRYDRFGNSLVEPTTEENVPFILTRVKELVNPAPLSLTEIAQLQFDIFGHLLKYEIFATCTVYVDVWERVSDRQSPVVSGQLEIMRLDLRVYGAQVVERMSADVSHVICDDTLSQRVGEWKRKNHLQERKFHLVGPEWVADSIAKGRTVDELAYTLQTMAYSSPSYDL